jgi:hypothetical protein
VFKTVAFVVIEWKVENPAFTGYPADDIATIESAVSQYYSELLADEGLSAFQAPNKVVDTTVSVLTQGLVDQRWSIKASINVYHIGDSGIAELSDLLRFVTNKNTTGSEEFSVLDFLIGMGVQVEVMSFSNAEDSKALAGGFEQVYAKATAQGDRYTQSERTLIVVTSVLSVALCCLSAILIWMAGGWLGLRKQVLMLMHREEELTRSTMNIDLKRNPTEDTDDEQHSPRDHDEENGTQFTNPSGILGVNPYYGKTSAKTFEGLGVKMTPKRPKRSNDMDSLGDIGTPSSEYSDSGRMPIGIQSMRKLLASRDDNDAILGDPVSMKRLDYDE